MHNKLWINPILVDINQALLISTNSFASQKNTNFDTRVNTTTLLEKPGEEGTAGYLFMVRNMDWLSKTVPRN